MKGKKGFFDRELCIFLSEVVYLIFSLFFSTLYENKRRRGI